MAPLKGMDLKVASLSFSSIRERLALLEGSSYYLFIGLLVIIVIIFMALTNSFASKREARVDKREAELNEFVRLAGLYKRNTASIEHLKKKLRVSDGEVSTGSVLEEIAAEIGIQKKITSFKPAEKSGEELTSGYIERGVQLEVEGVTLNQVVNFLYKIKTYKKLTLIKDFSMKADFANPELLDFSLQVVLVSRSAKEE
jgi:hypothetical protein